MSFSVIESASSRMTLTSNPWPLVGASLFFFQCSAYLELCILKDQVCCLPCPSVFLTATYLWDSRGTVSENPGVLRAPRGDWEERRLKAEGETRSTAQLLGFLSVNVSVGLSLLV